MEALAHDVEQQPDAFQQERADRFGCIQRGIGEALKRLKITRKKKTFSHPKADEEARRLFKRQVSVYELMKHSCDCI